MVGGILYPLGRHARVTIQIDLTGPNIVLASYKQLLVWGTFWIPVPCIRKLHTKPALTWTAVWFKRSQTLLKLRGPKTA